MKIGILSNCQHESLRVAMAALLPSAEVVAFDLLHALHDEALRPQFAATLATCDLVVTQDVAPGYGPLATGALRASVRCLVVLPSFLFAGFHPDSVSVMLDNAQVGGPTGGNHSRIAVAGFLAGLSPRETAALFNKLSFKRLGYFETFPRQQRLLLDHYATYGIDLGSQFNAWMEPGCFMHSAKHPRMRVMLDLARAACTLAGLTPENPDARETGLPDPLAAYPIHPVFPDIAAAIGIPPSGAFRGAVSQGHRPRVLGTESFVLGCHDIFRRTPLSVLRQVDGVAEAMAALGLSEAARPKLPQRPRGLTTTAFLTYHGTVLAIEAASSMLVHQPLLSVNNDSADLLGELSSLDLAGPTPSGLIGGVTLAPAPLRGSVSIQRGGAYLCAVPAEQAVRFNRPSVSAWESFLPLRAEDLDNLRTIAAGNWVVVGDNTRVPATVIRPLPGFKFALGDLTLDLRHDKPVQIVRPSGVPAWKISVNGKARFLTPDRNPPDRAEILLLPAPDETRPGEVGTVEEFRLSRNARLKLQGPLELLHTPLTVCDADRDWVHTRYFDDSNGFDSTAPVRLPGVGRRYFHATVARERDQLLLLSRSVEGVMVGAKGLGKDAGYLEKPPNMPPYLRAVGASRLLDVAATHDAAVIDGPVCVFYNPNLQNYYHWVSEALVALHIMAPLLPKGTRLLLPGTLADFRRTGINRFDHMAFLRALGFGQYATIEMPGNFARLRDAIWLESDSIFGMPAMLLQSFRTRAHTVRPPGDGPRRRLYIKRTGSRGVANSGLLETVLKPFGFETVALENMPAEAQIDLFSSAEFVVATHGSALANLLFCQPGTSVIELSPECQYRSYFWLFAEKLGLPYAVLPCPTSDGGFNGDLRVNVPKFRALFRMMRAVEG